MPNLIQKTVLIGLSCLLPVMGYAQTCQTSSIPATTPTSQFTDNGDGTVTDSKTGLMWKKCAEGQDPLTCSGSTQSYTWAAALEQAQTVNNSGGFATYTDWRVPNIKELASIVEEQCYSPAINTAVFPGTPSSSFWSASPYAGNGYDAWGVNFYSGYDYAHNKDYVVYVRLVRSGQ